MLRSADTAARLGGDEFGILLEGVSEREGAVRTAERILEALDRPFRLVAKEVFIHASIGIALCGPGEETVDALLRNADVAMYFAKSRGKHGFEVFEQRMHDDIVRRLELKDDLHRGIELEQFAVHYQPIVDICSGHDPRSRGADPLAPSRARPDLAAGLHPARRGDGNDPDDRRLGAADGDCRPSAAGRTTVARPASG